jgi:hypothetical protein
MSFRAPLRLRQSSCPGLVRPRILDLLKTHWTGLSRKASRFPFQDRPVEPEVEVHDRVPGKLACAGEEGVEPPLLGQEPEEPLRREGDDEPVGLEDLAVAQAGGSGEVALDSEGLGPLAQDELTAPLEDVVPGLGREVGEPDSGVAQVRSVALEEGLLEDH